MNISIAIQDAFILLFSGDETLWNIVWVSLKTSLVGLAFATPPALLLGYAIASHAFPGAVSRSGWCRPPCRCRRC
jgi:tungstate transport system permease protein